MHQLYEGPALTMPPGESCFCLFGGDLFSSLEGTLSCCLCFLQCSMQPPCTINIMLVIKQFTLYSRETSHWQQQADVSTRAQGCYGSQTATPAARWFMCYCLRCNRASLKLRGEMFASKSGHRTYCDVWEEGRDAEKRFFWTDLHRTTPDVFLSPVLQDRLTFRRIIVKNNAKKRKLYEAFIETLPLLTSLEVSITYIRLQESAVQWIFS